MKLLSLLQLFKQLVHSLLEQRVFLEKCFHKQSACEPHKAQKLPPRIHFMDQKYVNHIKVYMSMYVAHTGSFMLHTNSYCI